MTVGCDVITTLDSSAAFVTGDTLTVLGRTFLGSYFENPAVQASLRLPFLSCLVFASIPFHSLTIIILQRLMPGAGNA